MTNLKLQRSNLNFKESDNHLNILENYLDKVVVIYISITHLSLKISETIASQINHCHATDYYVIPMLSY